MIWARKTFGLNDYGSIHDKFASLFLNMGAPGGMMMVAVTEDAHQKTDVYLSVPEERFLLLFVGFSRITEGDLPEEATFLVGHDSDFEHRFDFPKQ